jgi:hypothetical protein
MLRYFTDGRAFPKSGYSLRLGTILPSEFDHPHGVAEKGVADGDWQPESEEYARAVTRTRATWQSRRDVADLIEACLSDKGVTYDTFYGISDNSASWFDISRAKDVIGYEPHDSADK